MQFIDKNFKLEYQVIRISRLFHILLCKFITFIAIEFPYMAMPFRQTFLDFMHPWLADIHKSKQINNVR